MTYVNDTENPRHCYVSAANRIVKRAWALHIPEDMPLGVYCTYRTHKGSRVIKDAVHFDDSSINKFLREATSEVYNITDPKELKNSHPIFQSWYMCYLTCCWKRPRIYKIQITLAIRLWESLPA